MASHHLQPTIRPRSLAHVLDDLREARSDMDAARTAVIGGEDADDRLAEAETRMEDLQTEADDRKDALGGSDANVIMGGDEKKLLRLWRRSAARPSPRT
jgi:hypothetical protein